MHMARRGALAPWLLPLALLTSLLTACGGAGEPVRSCTTDAECGPGALCIQSACVGNRPPSVALQLPTSPTTNRVLFLDATATDPDQGDAISRHGWTVTPVSASCEAEPVPTTGARLELVFWCAGTYEVAVVAEDGRGGVSEPARLTIDVAAAAGAPVVTTGPAIAVDHVCGGAPFACRPALAGVAASLPLSAVVDDPAGGALSARWVAVPPPGVDPGLVVTYAQGETSLVTEALVETPAAPIAGSWRFRLRVANSAGLLGRGDQLVTIGNRPPELGGAPFAVDHRHEAGAYLASGSLALTATDPDGDPIAFTFSLEETGTDGCLSHLGPLVAGTVPFDTRCADPARLLGLASRTIHAVAADGQGGATEALFPVLIGNRPPVLRLTSDPSGASVSLDHAVGACLGASGTCYEVGGVAAFDAADPDGDPVATPAVAAALAPGLTSSAGEVTTSGGMATFRFTTPIALPGEFRLADNSTGFSLVASVADPFGAAGRVEVAVRALDRPPVAARLANAVSVGHTYDATLQAYRASATLAGFEDPDGDPLRPGRSVGDTTCNAFSLVGADGVVECTFPYTMAPGLPPLASFVGAHRVEFEVSDGWAVATAPTTVTIEDSTPTATPFDGAVEYCACVCPKWSPDGLTCLGPGHWETSTSFVYVPVQARDANGDPVQATYTPAPMNGAQQTALPQACGAAYAAPSLPLTVQVTIDDGIGRVQTTSRVTSVYCSTAGQACTP